MQRHNHWHGLYQSIDHLFYLLHAEKLPGNVVMPFMRSQVAQCSKERQYILTHSLCCSVVVNQAFVALPSMLALAFTYQLVTYCLCVAT